MALEYVNPGDKATASKINEIIDAINDILTEMITVKDSGFIQNDFTTDEANILKAYTERRGIMATIKLEKEKYNRDAYDISYEFQGYDIKSDQYLIEVKAFKDATYKPLQLTKNEYETMNKEENYEIYVIEEAWDQIPKINIITNPKEIPFTKQNRDILQTKLTQEEYYECNEERWRNKTEKTEFIKL